MKKRLVTILQYVFFISLGLFFAWLSVKDINQERWEHIKSSLAQSRKWLFIPVVITMLIAHWSRTVRWKILMEPLGYKPSTFNTFSAVMIGYLVNLGVPRLGEVVKCTILARYEKIRADKLVGTIVLERTFDVVCLGIVFMLSLILQGNIIGGYIKTKLGGFFSDQAGAFSTEKLLIAGGIFVAGILLVYFLLKRFGHIDAVGKIKNILSNIWHGLTSIRSIKRKWEFLFHTVLIWVLYLACTTAGLYALKETTPLGFAGGLATLSVGSVGMIATPGGIGAYPLLVSELIGLYGIDSATIGTAMGWLLWAAQTAITLVAGVVCFALLAVYNKNRAAQPAVATKS
ncbi:MAG: lysylphosphatidylglycerol synthase transmembrane domain-containing protein [Chitinophagaceae bacterium]